MNRAELLALSFCHKNMVTMVSVKNAVTLTESIGGGVEFAVFLNLW